MMMLMENTILIIDYKRENMDSLATFFRQSGWMVHRALGGEEGLAAARRHLPSIVVSDLAMPGMSGFDVAEAMLEMFGEACPTMIALTGWSDKGVAQQALDAGFSVVLTKPVEFPQLLSVVRLGALARAGRASQGAAAMGSH